MTRVRGSGFTKQSGQAMPLGIAFILVGMLGVFVLFNTGQVAVNKQRLSDAADSAAYSGLVWQARALNFQAYTNRAMIANDVTIGQAASLASWSTYAESATSNFATATSVVPVLNTITRAISTVFSAVNAIVVPVADVMVDAMSIVNTVIGVTQEAMYASSFAATPDIVYQVAQASDEEFDVATGYAVAGLYTNLKSWESFTEKYDESDIDQMRERTDLINESRDGFATHRQWHFFENFWLFSTPFTKHRIYYDGRTKLLLSDDGTNWEWVAKDAASLHNKYYYFSGFRWKSNTIQVPIGWAAAYANSDSSSTKTIDASGTRCRNYTTLDGEPCDFLPKNETAEELANVGFISAAGNSTLVQLNGYQGVNAFRSLSQSVIQDEDNAGDPVLRLRTEVSMDIDKTETSNDWVHQSEPFETELTAAGTKLSSISIAEVYYRHPQAYRTSSNEIAMQRANGYNPYWDVRLAPVDAEERLAALALRVGLNGGIGSVAPSQHSEQLAAFGGGDPLIDVDPGGNVSDLPSYIGTLASAMELDESVGAAIENKALDLFNDLGEFSGFNLAELPTQFESFTGVDEIRARIEDELKDQLEMAIDKLIASVLGGSIGDVQIAGVSVDTIITTAEEVHNEAQALTDEMERIRTQVALEAEAALIRESAIYDTEVAELRALITTLQGELDDLTFTINTDDGRDPRLVAEQGRLQARIDGLYDAISDALAGVLTRVTDTVIDTMVRNGTTFFAGGVSREMRGFIEDVLHPMVREYLSTSLEERAEHVVDGVLPWDSDEPEDYDEPVIDETYDDSTYGDFEK